MAKFNRGETLRTEVRKRTTSAVRTSDPAGRPDTTTHEGGAGYLRDARGELFLLAVSNLSGEDTFYEQRTDRDKRYAKLVRQVAVEYPVWTFELLTWLRSKANMRSASVVGAVEAVRAWLARPKSGEAWYRFETEVRAWQDQHGERRGIGRVLIDQVCQRADEPGELLAYHTAMHGRALPKPIKRGLADAIRRLYTEYAMLKYDTATRGGGKGYRFGDVIDLVHPRPWVGELPSDPEALAQAERTRQQRGALYKFALDTRHGRSIDLEEERLDDLLPTVHANHVLRWMVAHSENGVSALTDAENLRAAGMTWEDVLSLAGSRVDKAELWNALIPNMGYMALLRNLRNFDEAGISRESIRFITDRLADPQQVARSRQFPFRFYSAYVSTSNLRWSSALDEAITLSCRNIPLLPGRTLVLCDTSGSMSWGHVSSGSKRTYAEVAALFACALAVRAAQPDARKIGASVDLVGFATTTFSHPVRTGGSLLTELKRFVDRIGEAGGGTDIAGAVRSAYSGHDRVIILSDMQTMDTGGLRGDHFGGYTRHSGRIASLVPADKPIYGFNLAGYRAGAMPSGTGNRHEFGGGLTDQTFRLIPLLEAGENTGWPWEVTED